MDVAVSRIAAAIGEPARARILYELMDNRARTSTELALIGEVSPSTASVHLSRLKRERLVKLMVQGKHRYYALAGADVARALESLSVLAGRPRTKFVPRTPDRLRLARTCYDHIAGTLGVELRERLESMGWIAKDAVTAKGTQMLHGLGIDVDALRAERRRFAYGCLDWSERRCHLGGALGAALLELALRRRWVTQDLDSRALSITARGRRELFEGFDIRI
jgi:DNA-binding transcriptional ArsR family regulator